MGKRKGRKQSGETLISRINNCENEREEEEEVGRFFACYLLTSLCPRFKGHTYIGFTVNPRRRIRQHNGEIGCGAWRTKRKRPWEMVLCIYGFPTNVAALQFEWAWQHPVESLAVRKAAASFKSLSGVANKIKLAYTMLTLPAWQSLNLTVNFFSTKYQKYMSGCPSLSEQMKTRVCSMDDLPCYNGDEECDVSMSLHESTREESLNSRETKKDDASFVSGEDFEKDCEELQINLSPVREENQGLSFNINTVEKSRSSSFDGEKDYQLGIKSPVVICRKIEIIDLFTPSPCYVIKSGCSKCKKRRRPTLYPEIIDLTNSPLFV